MSRITNVKSRAVASFMWVWTAVLVGNFSGESVFGMDGVESDSKKLTIKGSDQEQKFDLENAKKAYQYFLQNKPRSGEKFSQGNEIREFDLRRFNLGDEGKLGHDEP